MSGRTLVALRLLLAVVVLGLSLNLISILIRQGGNKVSPIVTYQVVLDETVFGKNGLAKGGRYLYAVRSDGSTVTQSEVVGENSPTIQRTVALSSGERVTLDEVRELKMTTIDGTRLPLVRDPKRDCLASVNGAKVGNQVKVREERLDDRRVVVLRSTGVTTWYALEMGCAPLRQVLGSETAPESLQVVGMLRAGEPDPAVFHVPDSYTEVGPIELFSIRADTEFAARHLAYYNRYKRQ